MTLIRIDFVEAGLTERMSAVSGARGSKLSRMKKKLPPLHFSSPPPPIEIDKHYPNLPQEVREVVKSHTVTRVWFYSGSGKTGSKFKIDLESKDEEWNSFILLETNKAFILPRSKSLTFVI